MKVMQVILMWSSVYFTRNRYKTQTSTFLWAPANDILEIFCERFSGAFSSSIITVACSIQLFDLQSLYNIFNPLIRVWKNKEKLEAVQTPKYSFSIII